MKDGWVADAARTFPVGDVSPVAGKLLDVTEGALFAAVEQCRVGNRLGDVSNAVQKHVESQGLSIVRSLVGHGIGRDMHEEPQIPNYGPAGKGTPLEEGMVLAVEPMVNAGRHMVRMGDDGWSIYSQDGSLAAHFEFTIAITAAGPRILTPWHHPEASASGSYARRSVSSSAPSSAIAPAVMAFSGASHSPTSSQPAWQAGRRPRTSPRPSGSAGSTGRGGESCSIGTKRAARELPHGSGSASTAGSCA